VLLEILTLITIGLNKMLDFINTNDTELKEYNSKTKNAMQQMKAFCDADSFIIDSRKKAHLKVNRAIVNGKIHWFIYWLC
jgi:hypothetical protein